VPGPAERGPASVTAPASTEEGKADRLLRLASALAVGGSALSLAVPAALLLLADRHLYGLSAGSADLLHGEGLLVVVGGVLVVLALFLYRRAFAHLKHVDARLRPAAWLCLVGSVGALALVVAGALLTGGSSAVSGCLAGPSSHALSCLRSADPTAGYLAIAGFWLVWLGVVGLALGLVLSGRHFRAGVTVAGGALFALLAADLLFPFAGSLVRLPGIGVAVAIAPFAAVAGAALVLVGTLSGRSPRD